MRAREDWFGFFLSLVYSACGGLDEAGRLVRFGPMGSTGEPDRKRRLSDSFVPPAKRPALPPSSDDKKVYASFEVSK